uniref:Uncharacterized protein n=1 Tax=Anguilla anguilla TaxID=7936 RepID=A0A0E9VIQ1_ANGAN
MSIIKELQGYYLKKSPIGLRSDVTITSELTVVCSILSHCTYFYTNNYFSPTPLSAPSQYTLI